MANNNEISAKLAVRHGIEGAGYTFIRNGRTLREFQEWLHWNRQFDCAYFRRESWYSPL